ncbi:MAG: hypothetical protein HAW63_03705 [Bdellovibrionaceae bacterium]|nr:hypothetical protein [Pseudobdellovibrionaceae bacterium]
MKKWLLIIYGIISFSALPVFGSEAEARGYFSDRAANFNQRYLNFYLYNAIKDTAYSWGKENSSHQLLKWSVGISYKWANFKRFGDSIFKVKVSSFNINKKEVLKNSFLVGVSFPDIDSGFPFYFGVSIGPGFFLSQLPSESILSLDYQGYLGFRFLNIYNTMGAFLEWGFDNHFLLLSSGQYNSVYLAVGLSFVF